MQDSKPLRLPKTTGSRLRYWLIFFYAGFLLSGPGWQTRIDAALKEWLETHHKG